MKKILSIFALIGLLATAAQAQQTPDEELQQNMDDLLQHMEEFVKGFGGWIDQAPSLMDSARVYQFHLSPGEWGQLWAPLSPDSLMTMPWQQQLEESMEKLSETDIAAFEDIFKNFGIPFDLLQQMPPLQREDTPSEDKNAPKNKTKKKKRRTTTL